MCLISLGLVLQFGGLLHSGTEPSGADPVPSRLSASKIVASGHLQSRPSLLEPALLRTEPTRMELSLNSEPPQAGKTAARLPEMPGAPSEQVALRAEPLVAVAASPVESSEARVAGPAVVRDSSPVLERSVLDAAPAGSHGFSRAGGKRTVVEQPLPPSRRHPAVPLPPARPSGEVAFAGVWGPTSAACAPQPAARAGWLQAKIGTREARSGNTVCTLKEKQRNGDTWDLAAHCTARRTKWRSNVRLALTGDRLLWKSERGAQAYLRCDRVLVASR